MHSARLYVTALGVYDATINGRPVSGAVLEPPDTDYARRIVYATYDVTAISLIGQHHIGTFPRVPQRHRRADATAAAGDQGYFAFAPASTTE